MKRRYIPKNAHLVPGDAKLVFKGIIFDVYQWQQKLFDGSMATFEMLKRPDTVKVIAIKDGRIVVVHEEQPHYGTGYELPGGRHDVPGEDELDCGKRELLEETGMKFRNWKLVETYQPASKIEAFVYYFLATGFESEVAHKLDAGEKIELELLDFDDCLKLSRTKAGRYLPKEILEKAGSLNGLENLPSLLTY